MIKKNKKYLNIFIFGAALGFLVFNDLGIIKLISISNQRQMIEDEINSLIAEEQLLINEISLLQSNPEYIKKIAREKFHMCPPGEKIFRVRSEKTLESE